MNNINEIKNKFKASREFYDKILRNHQWHFYKDKNNNENDDEEEKHVEQQPTAEEIKDATDAFQKVLDEMDKFYERDESILNTIEETLYITKQYENILEDYKCFQNEFDAEKLNRTKINDLYNDIKQDIKVRKKYKATISIPYEQWRKINIIPNVISKDYKRYVYIEKYKNIIEIFHNDIRFYISWDKIDYDKRDAKITYTMYDKDTADDRVLNKVMICHNDNGSRITLSLPTDRIVYTAIIQALEEKFSDLDFKIMNNYDKYIELKFTEKDDKN